MRINAATVASVTPIIRLMNAKFQRDTGVTDLTCMNPPSPLSPRRHGRVWALTDSSNGHSLLPTAAVLDQHRILYGHGRRVHGHPPTPLHQTRRPHLSDLQLQQEHRRPDRRPSIQQYVYNETTQTWCRKPCPGRQYPAYGCFHDDCYRRHEYYQTRGSRRRGGRRRRRRRRRRRSVASLIREPQSLAGEGMLLS